MCACEDCADRRNGNPIQFSMIAFMLFLGVFALRVGCAEPMHGTTDTFVEGD